MHDARRENMGEDRPRYRHSEALVVANLYPPWASLKTEHRASTDENEALFCLPMCLPRLHKLVEGG